MAVVRGVLKNGVRNQNSSPATAATRAKAVITTKGVSLILAISLQNIFTQKP